MIWHTYLKDLIEEIDNNENLDKLQGYILTKDVRAIKELFEDTVFGDFYISELKKVCLQKLPVPLRSILK